MKKTGHQARTVSVGEALAIVRRALKAEPGNLDHWKAYVAILSRVKRVDITQQLIAELTYCLGNPALATPSVRNLTVRVFHKQSAVRALLQARKGTHFEGFTDTLASPGIKGRMGELSHPLVTRVLTVDRVADADTELFLSTLRRHMLEAVAIDEFGRILWRNALDFLCALAIQSFINEYAWFETEDETRAIAALLIEAERAPAPPQQPEWVALLAAYRPLHRLPLAATLKQQSGDSGTALWRHLLKVQIDDPMEEQRLRSTIPALTAIRDRTSRAVRRQYEENPYPRWVHPARVEAKTAQDYVVDSLAAGAGKTVPRLPDAPEILIAGCGTGREPIELAFSLPAARITAVDLSLASLSYAARKAASLGVATVAFGQADLLELGALDRRFDMIVSSGVLHHMRAPSRGLAALVRCLKPDGVMNLALYSERARGFVAAAQQFIADQGYPATDGGMRRSRMDLLTLPADHPARAVTMWRDFYTFSTCRDLLFHVQEHCFTPSGLRALIDGAGLRFLGFRGLEPGVLEAYRRRFPQDPHAIDLALWDEFEVDHPHTFVAMYKFWVTTV